jgi:hypothetical protein
MDSGDGPAEDDGRQAAHDETDAARPRQRVVRTRGGRRARLTPAPGTDPAPEAATPGAHDDVERGAARPATPDDERITRERPPHW